MRRIPHIGASVAAALWLAFAVVGGLAAMAVFPAARALPLSMPGLEPLLAEHPDLGRQLIAGMLVEKVFLLGEGPRLVLAPLVVLFVALGLRGGLTGGRTGGRTGGPRLRSRLGAAQLAAACVGLVAMLALSFVFIPRFAAADAAYRAAAERSVAEALAAKPSVDAAHANASRVATVEAASVLALIALLAAARTRQESAKDPEPRHA